MISQNQLCQTSWAHWLPFIRNTVKVIVATSVWCCITMTISLLQQRYQVIVCQMLMLHHHILYPLATTNNLTPLCGMQLGVKPWRTVNFKTPVEVNWSITACAFCGSAVAPITLRLQTYVREGLSQKAHDFSTFRENCIKRLYSIKVKVKTNTVHPLSRDLDECYLLDIWIFIYCYLHVRTHLQLFPFVLTAN